MGENGRGRSRGWGNGMRVKGKVGEREKRWGRWERERSGGEELDKK